MRFDRLRGVEPRTRSRIEARGLDPIGDVREHDRRLDRTLDVVHERFGEGALTRARHLDAGSRSGR